MPRPRESVASRERPESPGAPGRTGPRVWGADCVGPGCGPLPTVLGITEPSPHLCGTPLSMEPSCPRGCPGMPVEGPSGVLGGVECHAVLIPDSCPRGLSEEPPRGGLGRGKSQGEKSRRAARLLSLSEEKAHSVSPESGAFLVHLVAWVLPSVSCPDRDPRAQKG